jgi:hypothetical protein
MTSALTMAQVLARVIDDGIAAARRDYTKPRQKAMLEGSIEGFEACRACDFELLPDLLIRARNETLAAHRLSQEQEESPPDVDAYWRVRCYELEVEWVCNVVSAVLVNQGEQPIITPTARGVMKAAEIVGVRAA